MNASFDTNAPRALWHPAGLAVLPVIIAGLGFAGPVCSEVVIETPPGGWRHSGDDSPGFRQTVNYPASSVNLSAQPDSAQIRGRISAAAKPFAAGLRTARSLPAPTQDRPATLVANGVAMPIEVNADGSFARPYAFGRGANSVEVRAANGESARVAFYDSNPGRTQSRLRVVLSWDSANTDLDLHVVSPDGQHVFYGNRVTGNGGALDVDVTTGYGPEIYANPSPPEGVYTVWVNYYGGATDEAQPLTVATVSVITQENTLAEKIQTFRVPLRRAGELTLVKSFSNP